MNKKILDLINEVLVCVDHIRDLKMAINDDIVLLSDKTKTYVYFRITEKLTESNLPFETVYNQYFY